MPGAGAGRGMGSECLSGTELQLGTIKVLETDGGDVNVLNDTELYTQKGLKW